MKDTPSTHLYLAFVLLFQLLGSCRCNGNNTLAAQSPYLGEVPAIIIFGDSTVDVGNNNYLRTLAKSNFPPYGRDFDTKQPTGRFSDGRVVTDFIVFLWAALFLGLPFQLPYLDRHAKGQNIIAGINFASAGSGFYSRTSVLYNVAGVETQLKWYRRYRKQLENLVGKSNATAILANALYVLSSGTNDFVNNYFLSPRLALRYSVPDYNDFIVSLAGKFLQDLYDEGARRIAVVSIPPYGCLPSQIFLHGRGRQGCVEHMNQAALDANQKIKAKLNILQQKMPGVRLAYLDSYSVLRNVSESPQEYGFAESRRGCCHTGRLEIAWGCNPITYSVCSNVSSHVYWDSFHPTQAMYRILAHSLFHEGMSEIFK